MHVLAILALDGVVASDLSTPIEVFGRTCLPDGQAAYRVRVCSPSDEIDTGTFTLRAPWRLDILSEADTIWLPQDYWMVCGPQPTGEQLTSWRDATPKCRSMPMCSSLTTGSF
jgi:hypothetical protein